MTSEDASLGAQHRTPPNAVVLWTLRGLALAAAGIAFYLLQLSLLERGLPAGCGAGSGCSQVLTSRWSQVFGVPVSAPALALYAAFFLATFFTGESISESRRDMAWSLLAALAAAMIAAAVWFVGLQLYELQAICPWCMAEHGLGALLAVLIFWQSLRWRELRKPWRWLGLGCASVAGLIAAQYFGDYKPPMALRLPPGKNADTGPGPDRALSVLNGKLHIAPHEEPHLGSADAPKLLVVLFDYCCPHCRAAHEYLLNGLNRYPNQFGVVLLPMPLDSKCNRHVEQTEARFEHSCELARLALAVWKAKPESFREFDAWLFEPEQPRTPQDARRKAEDFVTAAALDKVLAEPWIAEQIGAAAEAYAACKIQSGLDRLPIIMSPGFATLVGRPGSEVELFDVLEKELLLKPVAE